MNLLLLRHAESEWNRTRRWQGTENPPLSETGRRDAAHVATLLGPFTSIWTSPLARARETATIIAGAVDASPARSAMAVQVDDRLVEVHFAAWQGLTVDEIDAGWPGARSRGQRPAGAEADDEVITRAMGALASIASSDSTVAGTILVVTHGGLIRTVCRHLGHVATAVPNVAGVWLEAGPGGWRVSGSWRAERTPSRDSL